MSSNQARPETEEAESIVQASLQRPASSGSRRLESEGRSEAEELSKEKRQAEREAQFPDKRFMNKMQSSASKKSKNYHEHFATSSEYLGKERSSKHTNPRSSSPLTTSVGSVGNPKPRCNVCNKLHFGECRMRSGACFKCGSLEHFLKDCPKRVE
ncbi:uncharacterized protein [Gossypium hirsutum]|uniref:CCHC-type domain-containing protein n=1 Tax=Gossypium hirsutum TaxID=3635 RepID=A0A1U8KI28_GOSHI|nr:uncharacterized protein LOC107917359 [Gossypium hirsutum]